MTRLGRLAPALVLFLIAPLIAEFLLGDLSLAMLPALLFIAPMYGGGALIIREAARRFGRGWPTILTLGLAYGVLEEGIVTQSLFNPDYAGANLLQITYVPVLGIGVWWTMFVLTLHTVWSIGAPIALAESLAPDRQTQPWLGAAGSITFAVLFVIGCAANFGFSYLQFGFLAHPLQLLGAALITVVLVLVAFRWPTAPRHAPGLAPNPWFAGIMSLVLTTLFFVATMEGDLLTGWGLVGAYLLLDAVALGFILTWSRRANWGPLHVLAVAAGAILTYAWHGFPQPSLSGADARLDLISNGVFAALAVLLIVVAAVRVVNHQRAAARVESPST